VFFFKDLNVYLKIESVVVGLVGFVGIKEPSRSIGPWAMLEEAEESEDNQTVR